MIVNRTLVTPDDILDLVDGIGQRSSSFRFDLVDGVTGEILKELTPLRTASLTHDSSSSIKRRLTLSLGRGDTADINVVNNRVEPYMVFADGREFPLGRYVFAADPKTFFTSGSLSTSIPLLDEMITVDQPLSFSVNGTGFTAVQIVQRLMSNFPFVSYDIEDSEFILQQNWSAGTGGGQVLQAVAISGDYFPPWFGNDKEMHMIRSFDPATREPTFDFDAGNSVMRADIVESSEILEAPNRFVVVSNSSVGSDTSLVGIADIPSSAPHSFQNRGFYVVKVYDVQADTTPQAQAIAVNLARQATVFETVELATAVDPRHDSYDVVTWQGEKWLEMSWSMDMQAGGFMRHVLRKVYS
jgi:hypothetical protein